MPRFSKYHSLGLTQHQLDFVDVDNERDLPVYVDPFAIEVRDDIWAAEASEAIRVFFLQVLKALRKGNDARAASLMAHFAEPQETFLGVSKGKPRGRGVGKKQATEIIAGIRNSKAYQSGLLTDLSEMALYVEGVDRDKISDLTTNILREPLVKYTHQQCDIFDIPLVDYSGPPMWDVKRKNWVSKPVSLPMIDKDPVLLVPKLWVRRQLGLNSQEFYNKQITDFLVAETERANAALSQGLQGKKKKKRVFKRDVRKKNPKSKLLIADMVLKHPQLLDTYKELAAKHGALTVIDDDEPTVSAICGRLAGLFEHIPPGREHAEDYHRLVLGSLTSLFYPSLIQPHKEWEIHDGRKRIDIVFTNAADVGFFSQRRDDQKVNANTVIVECKNYSSDIANQELDQLLSRFDDNRGRLGILTCRAVDNQKLLDERCRDASIRSQGYVLVLSDEDIVTMLQAKSKLNDEIVEGILHRKYRDLLR